MNVAFVIEQQLGHATYADNLQAILKAETGIRPHWCLIPSETNGLLARAPWTVRAGLHARGALARLSDQVHLDALFFHTQVPAVLCTDWLKRLTTFVSLDATPLQFDQLGQSYQHKTGPRWVEALKWWFNRRCFGATHHLIAWSSWTNESLIADYGVPEDKVTVIPPGVIVNAWRRQEPSRRPLDVTRILFVGGNLKRKGGLLLLEAFRELRPLNVELHVVTRDTVAEDQDLFVYRDIGPNDARLKALYHQCDIFALPTYGDCLPWVLAEAGAAGLASVSTAVGAIPEIVRHGETGLIVPVGDGPALTQALRVLITDRELRMRLGERATAHIRQSHDAITNAHRLVALIETHVAHVQSR